MDIILSLLQDPTVPFYLDIGYVEVIVGLIIGLTPTIVTAVRDRYRWGENKKVVQEQAHLHQSEAAENIAQAAGILLDQSQRLNEKNQSLVQKYEEALIREKEMVSLERKARREQQERFKEQEEKFTREIELLKVQVQSLNDSVTVCSKEIIRLIRDIQLDVEIDPERLKKLETEWLD